MQHELNDEAGARAAKGMAYAMTGAYVGAILLVVTAGITDKTEMLWTSNSLHHLFSFSLVGVIFNGWWILPIGAVLQVHFFPRLSQWRRKAATMTGVLLGAALGLLSSVVLALVHQLATRTIQVSFVFLPVYCAVWCGGYSWLKAKRVYVRVSP